MQPWGGIHFQQHPVRHRENFRSRCVPLALHGDEAPVTGAWGHKLSYHSVVFLIASCLEVCVGSYIWVCVCVRAPTGVGKSWGRGAIFFQWMSLLALRSSPRSSCFLCFMMFSTLKDTSSSYLLWLQIYIMKEGPTGPETETCFELSYGGRVFNYMRVFCRYICNVLNHFRHRASLCHLSLLS